MGVDRMSQYEADKLNEPSKPADFGVHAGIPFERKHVEKPAKPNRK